MDLDVNCHAFASSTLVQMQSGDDVAAAPSDVVYNVLQQKAALHHPLS